MRCLQEFALQTAFLIWKLKTFCNVILQIKITNNDYILIYGININNV